MRTRFRYLMMLCSLIGIGLLPAFSAWSQTPGKLPAPGPPPAPTAPKARPLSPATGAPVSPGPGIPRGPQIREFTGPEQFVLGETIRLGWRVDPSATGSPVAMVGLYQGETVVAGSLPPSGTREVRLTSYPIGATSVEYTLKARDRDGNLSSRIVRIGFLSPQQALRQVTVALQADPREFRPGIPVGLRVNLQSAVWPMSGLNIRIVNGSRAVGDLSGVSIRASLTPAGVVRDAGFTGEPREYAVDVEYRGNHLEQRFRVTPVPYYTLGPESR